jgi:signal transduction histidine kinase/DNA-binding response OmpR family regulator
MTRSRWSAFKGETNESIKHTKKAIEYWKQSEFKEYISAQYFALARIYNVLKMDSLSIQMANEAIRIWDTIKNPNELVKNWIVPDSKRLLMKYESIEDAEAFVQEYIPIMYEVGNLEGVVSSYAELALKYLKEKKYTQASDAMARCYEANAYDERRIVSNLYYAEYYKQLGDFQKAKYYFEAFDSNYQQEKALFGYWVMNENILNVYLLGSEIYSKTNDFKKATYFANEYIKYQDNLLKQKELGLLEEFAIQFEVEKKEKELALTSLKVERAEKNRLLMIGLFAFVLLIIAGLFYLYQKRRKYRLSLLQQKLEINRQRTQFFENVFHEIRTPISIISGYLSLIHRNRLQPNLVSKYADVALRNCDEITVSSNDFLTLVKSQKLEQGVHSTVQNLHDFLQNLCNKYKDNMSLKSISFQYVSNIDKSLELETDYDKLEKIINNLIMNAIKYSPENTQITFSSLIENESLIFKVQDQGYGIPEKEQAFIFDRFYQASSKRGVISGVGIGLSLVKNFVTLLQGEIQVKSSTEEGSLFTVSLPIKDQNISDYVMYESESFVDETEFNVSEEVEQESSLPRLLLVEDNYEMTQYLKEMLNAYYRVSISLTGEHALERLQQEAFDIIVSDFRMPGIDGLDFKETINATQHQEVPFIMITASTLPETKQRSLALGINDYLIKPFRDRELLTRIQVLLSNKKSQLKCIEESIKEDNSVSDNKNFDKVVKLANTIIVEHLSDETFSVQKLAEKCNYSTRQFTRIIKNSKGLSPNKLILEVRLLTAYKIIIGNKEKRIKQVMYDVGINSYGYFNKVFTQRFGLKPSELMQRNS